VDDIVPPTPVPPPPTPVAPPVEAAVAPPEPEPIIQVHNSKEDDLQAVPGISDYVARNLNAIGVYTVSDLIDFPRDRLITIEGIGRLRAKSIGEYLDKMVEIRKNESEDHEEEED
jgi:predicted flap endonuclease-1-like 5' DNA nuclease